ncbi:beta-galactosidase [Draconibacterium mangrovi]|uniref:beta-galactosidase n=1 Tax=Draconibacterium mangrovi TaxID=2697469 RepID=UPI001952B34E|nr:beta-galactosidase [Draconibacterium mangrovi]
MNKLLFLLTLCMMTASAMAQQEYKLTVPAKEKTIYTDHFNLGGSNPAGHTIGFNSFYMTVDGKPYIPIMGEIHFSRLPHEYWEEAILKMKSGGINVISTYVFWSIHEEKEGVFDWSGDRDLRHFLELCKKHNLNVLVRIGPFCHGEIRNGGIPDWIYGRPFEVRSNDEGYLFYAKRLYHNIAEQLKGLYYKDGGTIIGIQLENELQHSAAPWAISYPGQEKEMTVANYDADITKIGVSVQDKRTAYAQLGSEHLATLKKMAIEEGMIAPLYTVTGWGMAAILENETIPVGAAYPYPFWADPSKSNFFLFKDVQLNPDYGPVRYDGEKYPAYCAEMGVGAQIIYERRPGVLPEAAEALMVRTLGSGANGIGYYMYHGGLTPQTNDGIFFSDEPMGIPKISYDYQAPLGEYGKTFDSYYLLRLIHLFTENFGDKLAPMGLILPDTNSEIKPDDKETLRYSVRSNGDAGFVFMNNFQDHDERLDQSVQGLSIQLADELIQFPAFVLKKDESVILPFNMDVNFAKLNYATVQPLAIEKIAGIKHYFFFAIDGFTPEYVFEKSTVKKISGKKSEKQGKIHVTPTVGFSGSFSLTDSNGEEIVITTLTRQQALGFNQLNNTICITDAVLMDYDENIQLQSRSNTFSVTIPSDIKPDFTEYSETSKKEGQFTTYTVVVPSVNIPCDYIKVNDQRYTFKMDKKEFTENLSDIILDIDYTGDVAFAFIDGKMINDHFYYGKNWQIGLKSYADDLSAKGMYFYFKPMKSDASFLVDLDKDKIPDFSNGPVCNVRSMKLIPEYKIDFTLK